MDSKKIIDINFRGDLYKPYVNDHGIYAPVVYDDNIYDQCLMTKEMFVAAYNRWIKNEHDRFIGEDDADDWCD